MFYEVFTSERFFSEVTTEEAARDLIWRCRSGGKEFQCPHCRCEEFYQHKSRVEIRECKGCKKQVRVRLGQYLIHPKQVYCCGVRLYSM